MMMTIKKIGALLAVFSGITGCSHGPVVQDYPDTADAAMEVSNFNAEMKSAMSNQLNVLSPHNYQDAQSALESAQKSLDQQKNSKDTLHRVAEGHAYLNRANEVAQVAHANIDDVIIARHDAIQAGANQFFASDFSDADKNLKDVTSNIEKNDLQDAVKNRSTLQSSYLVLELNSIKEAHLRTARNTIALAVKEGAKDYAPRSLAIAEKSMKDTEAFITANRHESEQVTARSNDSQIAADHLLKITRSSKTGKKTSSEDTALKMEGEQNKVGATQSELNETQDRLARKGDQLAEEQGTTRALTEENKNLESDQAFNRSFEAARAEFTPSEAEVYKQGNTLTIRLRGLQFSSSQALLKGSNFTLLAKVQKVIRDFGHSSVIVEGHTDSRGGKALNEKLSTNRAQAVKDYFVSNEGTEAMNIKSIGYDFQKPLATNKTASGRAQNRRVDVLIQAEAPAKE